MTKAAHQPPNLVLTIADCEIAYTKLSEYFAQNPLPNFAKRYEGRLEAVLGNIQQEVFGKKLYPSIGSAAAALFVLIIKDHPFTDGNKRIAVLLTDFYCMLNKVQLTLSFKEMYSLALLVAEDQKLPFDTLKSQVEAILVENSQAYFPVTSFTHKLLTDLSTFLLEQKIRLFGK